MTLEVKVTVCPGNEEMAKDSRMTKSLASLDYKNADEDTHIYKMDVTATGKYSRKATWEDLNIFTGMEITSDVLRDWIVNYQKLCFPSDLEKDNHVPKKCGIINEKGFTVYKDFGWKPIKLNLQTGMVDIKEKWTKEVCLDSFMFNYSTSWEQIMLEHGDNMVTSTLRKSKLAGHPLADKIISESEITSEFQEIEHSGAFDVLGNTEPTETDPETGDHVWKDAKSFRKIFQGIKVPEAGVSNDLKIVANESYLKARIYYKCYFSNDVATDHGEKFQGKQFWKFPIKFLLQYNEQPPAIVLYEDIELRFFSGIRISMENKEWEWSKTPQGRWSKENVEGVSRTSMPRRNSAGGEFRSSTIVEEDLVDVDEDDTTTYTDYNTSRASLNASAASFNVTSGDNNASFNLIPPSEE